VRVSGALVKVELVDATGAAIHVELGREQHHTIRAAAGDQMYITPGRVRVFTTDTDTT
jgi:hypothetical protein